MLAILLTSTASCTKEFLEKKPNKMLITPSTLADYWSLLDNREIMNRTPGMGQLSSDDQFFLYANYQTQTLAIRNIYTWNKEIYDNTDPGNDWRTGYNRVFYANCVLEGLQTINRTAGNQTEWDNIKGAALFFRAQSFYDLVEIFGKPYSQTAATDLGIPLRLSPNLEEISKRATLQQSYDQVISDLNSAKNLVPAVLDSYTARPAKPAVYALLARIYLNMGDYTKAENYADSCLAIYNKLLDYNTLTLSSTAPFGTIEHPEIIFQTMTPNSLPLISRANTLIDTLLLKSYPTNDLRPAAFFRTNPAGAYYFKGSYTKFSAPFSGLATDEMYLIRAEGRARRGETSLAMQDINLLLSYRFKKNTNGTSTYVNQTAATSKQALDIILAERRKELVFRGLRWLDLRRLNREPDRQVTLRRLLNGTEYKLEPNSPLYVFPIPSLEISISGLQQNER
ncbi:RagB/SusD family nutrient uptake outer membrane protein [Chitinophaga sp. CF418]|uniref:RagB/SusD family nutrient uptake outer membrane protein n=1 Tax=Chitinophaga sp. CF418 TaxID=1855287 RepID=UPI001CB87A40|nr:RagB/SusD family nutrient uptake outer membrane protein [Chitinophaga sp. CF418]